MEARDCKEFILLYFNTILLFEVVLVKENFYELHNYDDPEFPVIFHYDTIIRGMRIVPHWHENIEILYFTQGEGQIVINSEEVHAKAGDIVIIPTNAMHTITTQTECTKYYCLIVDRDFCSQCGFDLEEICVEKLVCDKKMSDEYDKIVAEFAEKAEHYQVKVVSSILSLLVWLVRNHCVLSSVNENRAQKSQFAMVKKVLLYIAKNYQKEITTDMLAELVGFNKYYFCHVFRKVTAMTPIAYINYIRCKKAKEILASGSANVGEAAMQCGFENLSYFTKIYRRYIGELPSKTMRR